MNDPALAIRQPMAAPAISVAPPTPEIVVTATADVSALEARWRDLETRANPSFFQSWTWTGCLLEQRFPRPLLVEARDAGRTVALALFNRRRRTLHLGETGEAAWDSPFIEFNGVLTEAGRETELTPLCLAAARRWFDPGPGAWLRRRLARLVPWRLTLSGATEAAVVSATAIGPVRCKRSQPAPFVDLATTPGCFLANRSANTRQQVRRSDRAYAAVGPIRVERAATLSEAHAFLDQLATLHQATWTARGQPGAFANPCFRRFHHGLLERGFARGEIDLLRVVAGSQVIGLLYNFRYRGAVLAYQSGFDYGAATRHQKPGLTCHAAAIRDAAGRGATRYDFLAGDDRYKRSLADRAETLHWIVVERPWWPRRALPRTTVASDTGRHEQL